MTRNRDSEIASRFSSARTWLIARLPFYGHLALNLKLYPDDAKDIGVLTAAIDVSGRLYLNYAFVEGLTDAELRFLLMHEISHPAFLFFARRKNRNVSLFNIAHDYVINQLIIDYAQGTGQSAHISMIEGGCLSPEFVGMSAEEVYEILEKRRIKINDSLLDAIDGEKTQGEESNKSDEKMWKMRLSSALQAAVKAGRGTVPASLRKEVDELLHPQLDWTDVLEQTVSSFLSGDFYTYSKINRRSEGANVTLAGVEAFSFPEVTVLWDTSGSMHGWETTIFTELKKLQDDIKTKIRLILIDAAIHADVLLDDAEEAKMYVRGGGGSDFRPAFSRLDEEQNESVVIAFTDGAIAVPSTKPERLKEVIWVLTGKSCSAPTAYGTSIYINRGVRVSR